MPEPRLTVLFITAPTFQILVALSILLSLVYVTGRVRARRVVPAGRAFDAGLSAVIAGIISARAVHVLLNWDYFRDHTDEIMRWSAGGLDAYGALIGATAAFWLVGRLRRAEMLIAWDAAAWALVWISFAAWWGCGANHCAYGREVQTLADYPAWLVWEERDLTNTIAPRFATQPLGMVTTAGVGLLLYFLARTNRLQGRRFPLTAFLLVALNIPLDLMRGDLTPIAASFRQTLVLFLWMASWIALFARARLNPHAPPHIAPPAEPPTSGR